MPSAGRRAPDAERRAPDAERRTPDTERRHRSGPGFRRSTVPVPVSGRTSRREWAIREQLIENYPSERLAEVDEEEPSDVRLDLTARSSGWHGEPHAA
jgi:hypothetical protein